MLSRHPSRLGGCGMQQSAAAIHALIASLPGGFCSEPA